MLYRPGHFRIGFLSFTPQDTIPNVAMLWLRRSWHLGWVEAAARRGSQIDGKSGTTDARDENIWLQSG
jgi:hypothetical protein